MLSLDEQNRWRERYRRENPQWQPATEQFAAWVRREIRPDSRVLDLGCGRGGLVEQLDHPLARMIGVDPDWHSLVEHRLPLPRCAASAERLPLPSGVVDVVFASWVLEHLASPDRTLREIARVLRPGGAFVFVTPNLRHPLIQLNVIFGRMVRVQARLVRLLYGRVEADTFPVQYRANTVATLAGLTVASGLILERLEPISDPTYLAFTEGAYRLMCRLEARLPVNKRLHLVGITRKSVYNCAD